MITTHDEYVLYDVTCDQTRGTGLCNRRTQVWARNRDDALRRAEQDGWIANADGRIVCPDCAKERG